MKQGRMPIGATVRCADCRQTWLAPGLRRGETHVYKGCGYRLLASVRALCPLDETARRGEFSIIIANLALPGRLAALLQPFAALYVLILASLAPLLAKESERIYYDLFARLLGRISKAKTTEEQAAEGQV